MAMRRSRAPGECFFRQTGWDQVGRTPTIAPISIPICRSCFRVSRGSIAATAITCGSMPIHALPADEHAASEAADICNRFNCQSFGRVEA